MFNIGGFAYYFDLNNLSLAITKSGFKITAGNNNFYIFLEKNQSTSIFRN